MHAGARAVLKLIHVQPYEVSIQQPIEIFRLVGGSPTMHSHHALHVRMRLDWRRRR